MSHHRNRRRRQQLDREEAAARARAAAFQAVRRSPKAVEIGKTVYESTLATLRLTAQERIEADVARQVASGTRVRTEADVKALEPRIKRQLEVAFATAQRDATQAGEQAKEKYVQGHTTEAEAAARAAQQALYHMQHARNVRHGNIGQELRAKVESNIARTGDILIAGGALVAGVLAVVYPPAGAVAAIIVAGATMAIKKQQANLAKKERKLQEDRLILSAATERGQAVTRPQAQAVVLAMNQPPPVPAAPTGPIPAGAVPAPAGVGGAALVGIPIALLLLL